jgi:protease I
MKALVLIADGFDDLQLSCPYYRLREEGVEITVASPHGPRATGKHGYSIATTMPIREVNPAEYDLLLDPRRLFPEKLRLSEEAVDVTRTFIDEDRRVAIVGHAAQLLISAGAMNGRRVTSASEIRDDVRAAGGLYRDESVIVDGNLVSCRGSEDLGDLCRAMVSGLTLRA